MACVTDEEAKKLNKTAHDLRLDVLVEVHDEAELQRALELETQLLGINNRDLRSFETKLETCERLAEKFPPDRIVVAESGIATMTTACACTSPASTLSRRRKPDAAERRDGGDAGSALRRERRALTRRRAKRTADDEQAHPSRRSRRSPYGRCLRETGDRSSRARRGPRGHAPETLALALSGNAKKGDVFAAARIAGIMAAKKTADLIPLCHPLALTKVRSMSSPTLPCLACAFLPRRR